MPSFYDFLGIQVKSGEQEIREAISRRYAEIEAGSANGASGIFKSHRNIIKAAEAVLLDPEKRREYDRGLLTQTPIRNSVNRATASSVQYNHIPQVTSQPSLSKVNDANRQLKAGLCPVCASPFDPGSSFCLVCGADLSVRTAPSETCAQTRNSTGIHQDAEYSPPLLAQISKFIGYHRVRGVIVSADPPYNAENEFILWKFLLKLGVFFLFVHWIYEWAISNPFLALIGAGAILLIAVVASAALMGIMLPILALLLSLKGKEKQITVRDVRLRDRSMKEHSVRFRGELRSGQASVGDEIEVWGRKRGGTIMARWGYNFRTHNRIWVRYQ